MRAMDGVYIVFFFSATAKKVDDACRVLAGLQNELDTLTPRETHTHTHTQPHLNP